MIPRPVPLRPASGILPWYREPWPWILMAGPFFVVVAGILTYIFAVQTENSMLVDNYYKEGLGINRTLDAESKARDNGYRARVNVSDTGAVRVALDRGTRSDAGRPPAKLHIHFVHPVRAQMDRTFTLESVGAGLYEARANARDVKSFLGGAPRWYVHLEDGAGAWRLTGQWEPARDDGLTLQATKQ